MGKFYNKINKLLWSIHMVFKVLAISICKHRCIAHKLHTFFFLLSLFIAFFVFIFFYYKVSMRTSHSSSHAFNLINDTHWEKVATPTTYSWEVENTFLENLLAFFIGF